MWYRSKKTGKMIHKSSSRVVNHIFGDGYFDELVSREVLTPIDPPNVMDILREVGSESLAIVRYREIFNCSVASARKGVRMLKEELHDIAKVQKKRDDEVSTDGN